MLKSRSRSTENIVYTVLWFISIGLYMLDVIRNRSQMSAPLVDVPALVALARTMLPFFLLFLLNNNVLIPRFLFRNKLLPYLFGVVLAVSAMWVYQYIDFMHVIETMPRGARPVPHPHMRPLLPLPLFLDFTYSLLVVGCNLAIALMFQRFDDRLEKESLMKANAESQLAYLKNQINPHFYMNMLNNIHGMIEIDPERAQLMVIDMSQLMRYMLYESSRQEIPLSDEIRFLRNYMGLMRQRFPENKVSVTSEFPSDSDILGVSLPPLLFLVFIENAFKHGVSYQEASFVAVRIEISDGSVIFNCMNSNHAGISENRDVKGIGLRNIRQRLSLIYGDNATLYQNETESTYTVTLTIPANALENNHNR